MRSKRIVLGMHLALLHWALLWMLGLVMLQQLRATLLEPYPVLQPMDGTLTLLQICTAKVIIYLNLRDIWTV